MGGVIFVEGSPSPSWPGILCRGHLEQAFDERSARMSSSAGRLRHEPFDERSAWKVHLAGHLRTRLPVDLCTPSRQISRDTCEHPPDPRPEKFQTRRAQHQMGCNARWRHADDPDIDHKLDQGIVALVGCSIKLDAMHPHLQKCFVHEDRPRSTTFHELLERRSPSIRRGGSTREGDRKILHDELVVDTADGACGIVRGSAIDGVLLAGGDGVQRTQRMSK